MWIEPSDEADGGKGGGKGLTYILSSMLAKPQSTFV